MERKVSNTILETAMDVVVDGVTYNVAPPSTATLIQVSGLVSQLPVIDEQSDILTAALRHAKDCKVVGEIIATLILGVAPPKRRILNRSISAKDLGEKLLIKSPSELNKLIGELLMKMEIADFFSLTSSLSAINLVKPTTITASGQQ